MALGTVPNGCVRRSYIFTKEMDEKLNKTSQDWETTKTAIIMDALAEFFSAIEKGKQAA